MALLNKDYKTELAALREQDRDGYRTELAALKEELQDRGKEPGGTDQPHCAKPPHDSELHSDQPRRTNSADTLTSHRAPPNQKSSPELSNQITHLNEKADIVLLIYSNRKFIEEKKALPQTQSS